MQINFESTNKRSGGNMLSETVYREYIKILEEEMIPAMGCTEPIALAYGAAKAREVLGCIPEKIVAKCSGNIIKNVRCVTIPNSGGLVGIEAGVVLGAVGGNAETKCLSGGTVRYSGSITYYFRVTCKTGYGYIRNKA